MHSVFGRDDDDAQAISCLAVVMGPTAHISAAVDGYARPSVAQHVGGDPDASRVASTWVGSQQWCTLRTPCCGPLKIESSYLAYAAVHGAVGTLLSS
jgi:hypothetical protein